MKSYYVYAYMREDGSPYYIGKGTGGHAWSSSHRVGLPPRDRIVMVERNLTELGAWAIERRLIAWYKRKLDGGILENIQPGGPKRGAKVAHTDATRAKLRAIALARPSSHAERVSQTNKTKPPLVCPHCNKEGRGPGMRRAHFDNCRVINPDTHRKLAEAARRLAEANKGRIMTPEHKANLAQAQRASWEGRRKNP